MNKFEFHIFIFNFQAEYHKEHVDKFISRLNNQYNASFVFHKTANENIHARHFSL